MHESRLLRKTMLAEFTADESVVLDLETHRYHTANPTAAFIWKSLESGLSDEEILKGLTSEFEVAQERAASSLQTFLTNLESRGLVAPQRP